MLEAVHYLPTQTCGRVEVRKAASIFVIGLPEVSHFLDYIPGELLISNKVMTWEITKSGTYSGPGNYILQYRDGALSTC